MVFMHSGAVLGWGGRAGLGSGEDAVVISGMERNVRELFGGKKRTSKHLTLRDGSLFFRVKGGT